MRNRPHTLTGRLFWLAVAMVTAVVILAPVAVLAAGGTFTDDDNSIFEADIEWLAAAEITLGCNPPTNDNFCPDDPVTRGQMAAFMRRLASNQVVDAATAAQAYNAALLDGSPVSHYNNPIYGNEVVPLHSAFMDGTAQTWAQYTITTEEGGVLINASAAIGDISSVAEAVFWVQVDDTVCTETDEKLGSVAFGFATIDTPADEQSMAITGVAQLTKGSHTLTLCGREFGGGGGDTVVYSPSLTAIFSVAGAYFPAAPGAAGAAPIPGTAEN